MNVTAVSLAVLGAFAFSQSPLRATQMLWVNLIMDSLGALALASEPPTPDQLERPPYGRNAPLVSFSMKFNLFGHSVYQMIVLIVLLFAGAGTCSAVFNYSRQVGFFTPNCVRFYVQIHYLEIKGEK